MDIELQSIDVSNQVLHQQEKEIFSVLDLHESAAIINFEEAFYKVFVNLHSNQLVRKIWDWDVENGRLKTKISYDHQIIFSWNNPSGEIKCASAINLNNSISQFGNFGFKAPQKSGRYCEVLTLFTQNIERANGIRLDRFFLRAFCVPQLQKLGNDFILATCAQRPLKTYLRWGWDVIDEATIENEKRYFLYYNINKNLQNL